MLFLHHIRFESLEIMQFMITCLTFTVQGCCPAQQTDSSFPLIFSPKSATSENTYSSGVRDDIAQSLVATSISEKITAVHKLTEPLFSIFFFYIVCRCISTKKLNVSKMTRFTCNLRGFSLWVASVKEFFWPYILLMNSIVCWLTDTFFSGQGRGDTLNQQLFL